MRHHDLSISEARKPFDLEAGRCETLCSSSGSSTYSETGSDLSTLCKESWYKEEADETSVSRLDVADRSLPSVGEIEMNAHDFELPEKSGTRVYRWIRWNFFSTYRRLFTLVFATNLVVLLVLAIRTLTARSGLTFYSTLTATSVNLALSILVRHEHFVNLLFRISTAVSPKAPLFVRRWIAKVYGYGGLHSGCAFGAVFWYIAFTCLVMYYTVRPPYVHAAITVLTFANLLLLLTITAFSHPWLRSRMHNWFEATHRYAGWTTITLFWAQTIVMAWVDSHTRPDPRAALGLELVRTPAFWCTILITLCVIYPWLNLRKQAVIAEPLSPHAIRLHFTHADVDMCQAIRIGDQPLKETHAFAVIAQKPPPSVPKAEESCSPCDQSKSVQRKQQRRQKGFSIVISRAGDWTSRIIANPPSHMYIRGTPTYGVLRIATLFSPVLIVATGSGIGPCLSLFRGRPELDCRVLWSTPSPLETYGTEIVEDVRAADPKAVIIDTRKEGRPDLLRRAFEMWKREGCEAVVLISNPKVTKKIIYGLEARGVPAFAPIFDS